MGLKEQLAQAKIKLHENVETIADLKAELKTAEDEKTSGEEQLATVTTEFEQAKANASTEHAALSTARDVVQASLDEAKTGLATTKADLAAAKAALSNPVHALARVDGQPTDQAPNAGGADNGEGDGEPEENTWTIYAALRANDETLGKASTYWGEHEKEIMADYQKLKDQDA